VETAEELSSVIKLSFIISLKLFKKEGRERETNKWRQEFT